MNIQKFVAPSSREALAKARHAFGDATLILSNRTTAQGVEVMATTDEALSHLEQVTSQRTPRQSPPSSRSSVEQDADQLAMSTLSFQDYVRERMLRRRHEAHLAQPQAGRTPTPSTGASQGSSVSAVHAPKISAGVNLHNKAPIESTPGQGNQQLLDELQSVKHLIAERFNTMDWLGSTRRQPVASSILLRLLKAGFSPSLSRAMVDKMPQDLGATEALDWVHQVLERNLKTPAPDSLLKRGGILALVGATGVGKTTTVAKLATQCAAQHGSASVGLITLDTYKSGAHEQLRQHGRMMGVVAHLAHDRAALEDLLNLLANKKMVLIDTAGLAPRDSRREEVLEVLQVPHLERVLVLPASAQADAMEDAVSAFRTDKPLATILTKTDEAVKLAPALDVLIRHQLLLQGTSPGPRVPDDWCEADRAALVRQALRSPKPSAFDPESEDLSYLFSPASSLMTATRMH